MAVLRNLEFLSQYTLSRIKDDTDGPLSLPANNYDLSEANMSEPTLIGCIASLSWGCIDYRDVPESRKVKGRTLRYR